MALNGSDGDGLKGGQFFGDVAEQVNVMYMMVLQTVTHYIPVLENLGSDDIEFVLCKLFNIPLLILATTALMIVFTVSRRRIQHGDKLPKNAHNTCSMLNVFDLAKTAYEPGHTEAVKNCIKQFGYEINSPLPNSGLTIFLCACLSGEMELVEYLISKGADIHATTKDQDSALYLATYGILNSPKPDVYLLELLIKKGCEVNRVNSRGYTPLHRAASKGNIRLIKFLLKHGADAYISNSCGIYPIDSAINAGHVEAAELLKVNISNPHLWDVVDPHTPSRIKLGLQSPQRKYMVESSRRQSSFSRVLT
ncbi:hypothetical protein ScPMuIL_016051 [Solemya velum]